jgi:hypothetical protein
VHVWGGVCQIPLYQSKHWVHTVAPQAAKPTIQLPASRQLRRTASIMGKLASPNHHVEPGHTRKMLGTVQPAPHADLLRVCTIGLVQRACLSFMQYTGTQMMCYHLVQNSCVLHLPKYPLSVCTPTEYNDVKDSRQCSKSEQIRTN